MIVPVPARQARSLGVVTPSAKKVCRGTVRNGSVMDAAVTDTVSAAGAHRNPLTPDERAKGKHE